MALLAKRILERGETPFLHVTEDNVGAIRVYQALGFTSRARIDALGLRAPAAECDPRLPGVSDYQSWSV